MGAFKFGEPVSIGIDKDLVLSLSSKFEIDTFVETGTNMGVTIEWASKYFEKCYTIEASDKIFDKNKNLMNRLSNVNFIYGDSTKVLDNILKKLEGSKIIFWLDSHYMYDDLSFGCGANNPLLEEIQCILSYKVIPFILIDDFRYIAFPPGKKINSEWPRIDQICKVLQSNKNNFYIYIAGDLIISVPHYARECVIYGIDNKFLYW